MRSQTYAKERDAASIARLKRQGMCFEAAINPELALDYLAGKPVQISDVLVRERVFSDANRGMAASDADIKKAFGTDDIQAVLKEIVEKGEVHLTTEFKARVMAEKRKRIIGLIHANGIDPHTGLPHPMARIENAFVAAKVRIDEHRSADDQVEAVLKKLKPIIPIRFETRRIEIRVPAKYAGQLNAMVRGFGKVLKQDWRQDGSVFAVVEMPAGLEHDFYDRISSMAHGSVETQALRQ